MKHTYEDLHGKTVAELREIAEGIEHEGLHGYTTMHKEELLPALCTALGIEAHEHHEVVGRRLGRGCVRSVARARREVRRSYRGHAGVQQHGTGAQRLVRHDRAHPHRLALRDRRHAGGVGTPRGV